MAREVLGFSEEIQSAHI